jgi:hypothetical protein
MPVLFTIGTGMGGSVKVRLPPETDTALKSLTFTVYGSSKIFVYPQDHFTALAEHFLLIP